MWELRWPCYSSQSNCLARNYRGCFCLFTSFKGVRFRYGYFASFSCCACLKENFASFAHCLWRRMGILFVPVSMGFWESVEFLTTSSTLGCSAVSTLFYDWPKWDSIYVLNTSETKSDTLECVFVPACGWCGMVICRLEVYQPFNSESWMMIFLSTFCSFVQGFPTSPPLAILLPHFSDARVIGSAATYTLLLTLTNAHFLL